MVLQAGGLTCRWQRHSVKTFLLRILIDSWAGQNPQGLQCRLKKKKNIWWKPVPVAAPSKAWVCGRSPAEIVGSNPTGTWMSVCCECCVFSGRGLCDELITRPGKSYRLWCVVVCDVETSWMGRPWPPGRLSRQKQTNKYMMNIKLVTYINLNKSNVNYSKGFL